MQDLRHESPPGDLDRRRFLQRILAGAGLVAATRSLRAAPPATPGLGFSLYGMKSLTTADALHACAEIGYRHVELALLPGYPTDSRGLSAAARQELRDLLAKHDLTASGLMDNLSLTADDATHASNLDRLKAAAEVAHALAPDRPPIFESVLGGKPSEWDAIKMRMADRARDWAQVAEKHKLTICLKPHVMGAVNSPDRLLWLHQQVASSQVKLCYDYSHFEVQGLDLAATLAPLIAETRFIHIKDTRGDAQKVQFLLPGEGRTDYSRYAALLKQHAWTGPVVVEVSSMVSRQPKYDPVAAARQCYARLGPVFAAV